MMRYAELQTTTNFSFLRGGSHPGELVATAQALGLSALAVTDRNTLAGVVRAHTAARQTSVKLVVGARLDLQDAPSLLCYPTDRAAYGRLCRLLTLGQQRGEKGSCTLYLTDAAAHAEGQIFTALPPDGSPVANTEFAIELGRLRETLPGQRLHLAAHHLYRGDDRARIAALADLAKRYGLSLVAVNDVHYHEPARRPLQDVLTCIRRKCTIAEAGFRLQANAERHLKPPTEMARLFAGFEDALTRTIEIAESCRFSLDELKYEYPEEPAPEGKTPQQHLENLAWAGARSRHPKGVPDKLAQVIKHELALIGQLNYAPYFLTVHDIVTYARSQDILCQGRGSAANSAVCFYLGITNVNPIEIDLLFERFISPERDEPPDIDIDFEHDRREEVIQYIYRRYGRERAGLAATVITYRARSAVREVGKAMGLTVDVTSALAGAVWGWRSGGVSDKHVREAGLDPADPLLRRTLDLATELSGFPRHLSQHVGGFVLSRTPLCEITPIGVGAMADRTFIEWDKDDLDALGLLKVDVLGLGMLSCIRRCFQLIERCYGRRLTLASTPREDPAVYDMLCRGDSIGVFQVESRAQMNMLPRLKPRNYYDLVIEVAIVRPGPIQGDMVHPYLRRRDGLEIEQYPAPHPDHGPADELKQVLGRTRGVPLFQEQAMRLAMVAAKFSAAEANELRRAMAAFRRRGTIQTLREKMTGRMAARGYDPAFAERCFNQIEGFGEYGFPESHAASFAHLVYISAWLKHHYPAAFACALLNSQPMGFYAPAQIVRDAREHSVEMLPADVSHSDWDSTLEPAANGAWALRLGLRQVDGLGREEAEKIIKVRSCQSGRPQSAQPSAHGFANPDALRRASGVSLGALERLAAADAFRSMGLDRRQALWAARALPKDDLLPLFQWAQASEEGEEPGATLPAMPLSEHVINDYQTLKLSLKAHPMSFLRPVCSSERIISCAELKTMRDGARVKIAGLVLVRQRPGSASGVVFVTLEDETGVANIVIWPQIFEQFRAAVMGARLILINGAVQRTKEIIHVVARSLEDRSSWLGDLREETIRRPAFAEDASGGTANGLRPRPGRRHPRNERVIPKSRDFH
jgi:error-prone DNA polymerase